MFLSAVKLGIYGIDSLLQPASSGQSMNYSLSHLRERAGGCRLNISHSFENQAFS